MMKRTKSSPVLPININDAHKLEKPVFDTRKTAQRRNELMDKAFCLFNFNCLGRCYGRSLLRSSVVRSDHPVHNDEIAKTYLPMFNTLSLSIRAIETLYEVFQLIDIDGSGEIDIDEFLLYFRLQNSRFAIRAFHILDADGSGEIDFDGSGYLDENEIEKIVKDLYGKRNYKKNASAQKCIQQLNNMKWLALGDDGLDTGNSINFQTFLAFSKNHPTLLYPAFQMQYDLQSKCLGSGFWQCAAEQRRKLEKIVGCSENDLLDVLQAMHAEEQEELSLLEPSNLMMGKNDEESTSPSTNVSFEKFAKDENNEEPQPLKNNRINRYKIKQKNDISSSGNKHLRSSNLRRDGMSSDDREKKKKEKKNVLKQKIKKQLRASRKATAKGNDPEKAKLKAAKKYEQNMRDERKRKEKKMFVNSSKEKGLRAKDASMAWQCRRCLNANYAVNNCTICGHSRGITISGGDNGPPLSPKRRGIRRRKTFA